MKFPSLTPNKLGLLTYKGWRTPPHVLEYEKLYLNTLYNPAYPPRLAIVAPVRHIKSYYFSWMGIATFMMNHKNIRVLYVAYKELADDFGNKIRTTIESYGPRLRGVTTVQDNRSKTNFKLTNGSSLVAVSSGTAISGFGFDLIILDDVQRKQEDTDSEEQRNKTWRYFYSDICNRLTPRGRIIALMARRHPDDIMGRLKEQSNMSDLPFEKRFTFSEWRAIQNDDTALWDDGSPDCWPLARLRATEKDYELAGQSYLFQCLYQGDPMTSPAGLEWHAGLFNDILVDEIPSGVQIRSQVISLDPSKGRSQKKGDFAAMGHIVLGSDGIFYVTDCRLVRQPGPELEDTYIAWSKEHEHDGSVIEADMDGGSMAEMVCRRLRDEHARLDLANRIHSVGVLGEGDKYERNRKILSLILCQHRLKIIKTGHYRLGLRQMINFGPKSNEHDDFVDMVSQGIAEITWLLTGKRYA